MIQDEVHVYTSVYEVHIRADRIQLINNYSLINHYRFMHRNSKRIHGYISFIRGIYTLHSIQSFAIKPQKFHDKHLTIQLYFMHS